jgi:squalene-hopene/tetraprenyl-beta-curcumene cyclase
MIMKIDIFALKNTIQRLQKKLLESRTSAGYWEGHLSSSALSTATATFALSIVDSRKHNLFIEKGLDWLCTNQNADGGWGDTIDSISNLSTTLLCYSAFNQKETNSKYRGTVEKMRSWLITCLGSLDAELLAEALDKKYDNDKSFSVPILTMCALAGRLGVGVHGWSCVKPLPFELAIFPHQLYKWLRLPVVSYALPALIAVGYARYQHCKPRNPLVRLIRGLTLQRAIKILESIQPENGGFLEATPLTAFVVMSLAASGEKENIVVDKGANFLISSMRADGSWPIDTNLASWVTTLALDALTGGDKQTDVLPKADQKQLLEWLLHSQHRQIHPYTHCDPGGWAWTDLAGAVPDADDTSGVLIALRNLDDIKDEILDSAEKGIQWLLDIQNTDGGIPTFCRGWSKLPFDRSTPDITSHAIAAMSVWEKFLPENRQQNIQKAIARCISYLKRVQRENGSWIPLWFGNQMTPEQENPVYGTAKVVINLLKMPESYVDNSELILSKSIRWLLTAQNTDKGWGGEKGIVSSIEETALAIDALAGFLLRTSRTNAKLSDSELETSMKEAVLSGVNWLICHTGNGTKLQPSPIGLYFARLWYCEELYPVAFCLSAMNKVQKLNTIGYL